MLNNLARVSVIIVNWNHGHYLGECLRALVTQDYEWFDIIVVDNHSTDGSPAWIAQNYPAVRLYRFDTNRGFAAAFNCGVRLAAAQAPPPDFVLSLNADVVVRAGFIRELVNAVSQDARIGIAAPKLLRSDEPDRLDSTGLFVDRRRRPYDRGQGEPDCNQYDQRTAVFGACGAAALYRQTMLDDLALNGEYLDESFFAYYEDADLAWRAQLRGWHAVYAPRAIATHVRGWGDTWRKRKNSHNNNYGLRLALRNRYLMTIKNDAAGHFVMDLPFILAAEAPRLAYAALFAPDVLLGLVDLVRLLPQLYRKRQMVRRQQTVDDAAVRRWFLMPRE